ncbi:MAG: hypothetical protein ABSG32_33065 [Terriglobia bacterium]|jgi:hypothetical protein
MQLSIDFARQGASTDYGKGPIVRASRCAGTAIGEIAQPLLAA